MLWALTFLCRIVAAKEVPVPIPLQAELLLKVLAHDRNLATRAGARIRAAIVVKNGNAESTGLGTVMASYLHARQTVAELPFEVDTIGWTNADDLATLCRDRGLSLVYVSAGFSGEDGVAIARAFDGVSVFSAAAEPGLVAAGVLLGFDLVSGKPKLIFNRTQARRQNVAVHANVLQLMRVIE